MNLFILSILALFLHLCQAAGVKPEATMSDTPAVEEAKLINKMNDDTLLGHAADGVIEENNLYEDLKSSLGKMSANHDVPKFWSTEQINSDEADEYMNSRDPKFVKLEEKIHDLLRWQILLDSRFILLESLFREMEKRQSELAVGVVKTNYGILFHLAKKEIDENVKPSEPAYTYEDHKSGGLVLNKPWKFHILNANNELTDNRVEFNFDNGEFANPKGKFVRKESRKAIAKGSVQSRVQQFSKKALPPGEIDVKSGVNQANGAGGGKSPHNSPRPNVKSGMNHEVDINGAPASPPISPHKGQNPNPFGNAASQVIKVQPNHMAQPNGAY